MQTRLRTSTSDYHLLQDFFPLQTDAINSECFSVKQGTCAAFLSRRDWKRRTILDREFAIIRNLIFSSFFSHAPSNGSYRVSIYDAAFNLLGMCR